MSDKKPEFRKYCGLHGCHVYVSEYNKNGTCPCLSCKGIGVACHKCETRLKLAAEVESILEETRCQLCWSYDKEKQK